MYLVDTNIWLEVLLEQDKENEAHEFLSKHESSSLCITDFSVFSIGVIFSRLDEMDVLEKFYDDVIRDSEVNILRLYPNHLHKIIKVSDKFGLDFDDSYQYLSALEYDLDLISFDDDFDDTDLERFTPKQIIS